MSRRKRHREPAPPTLPQESAPSLLRWPMLAVLGLLVVVTVVVYLPALQGGYIWDDDGHITKPEVRSAEGLYRIWFDLGATQQYYPLLHTAFWIEYQLWGDNTLGYHLANVLLHATAAWLVYLILCRLKIPGALLAAAIFALHPVHVESVAWISEQKNTLSALFYLSAMLAYLHFDELRNRSPYLLALGLFVLGLLTKTVTASLPAALLVVFWWQRGRLSWRRDVQPLVPFFLLGAVAGLLTAWVERTLIGAEGAEFHMTLVERGLLAGRAPWFYLSKLLWPANLIFVYPRWELSPAVWWQWLFPLATLAVLVTLVAIRHRTRAPLAGWLLFVGTLFPVLGFFNVYPFLYSFVADHFQYLASLGIIVLAAAGIVLSLRRLSPQSQGMQYTVCLLLVGTLALLTFRQSRMYSDIESLYQTTIDRNPSCWMAHNNLGIVLAAKGLLQEAIDHYEAALGIKPAYARGHNNLGVALFALGKPEQAIDHFQQALSSNPDYFEAHSSLGRVLVSVDRVPEAVAHFEEALRLKPGSAETHTNLGNALKATDRPQDAVDEFVKAVRIDPNNSDAQFALANSLVDAGRPSAALAQFARAAELNPDDARIHYNWATTLFRAGRAEEAVSHFRRSLVLNPDSAEAHNNLGLTLSRLGRSREAISHLKQAVKLDPDYVEVYNNLGGELFLAKRTQEAIEYYRRALSLSQNSVEAHVNLGSALASTGKMSEAITHFQRALELDPTQVEAHRNLAQALAMTGRLDEAVDRYQQALQHNPNDFRVYAQLAEVYSQMNRPVEAIAAAQRALDLARRAGQTSQAQQIEAWLANSRAATANSREATQAETTPTAP